MSQTFKQITDFQDHWDKVVVIANELYERLTDSRLVAKTVVVEFKTMKFDVK